VIGIVFVLWKHHSGVCSDDNPSSLTTLNTPTLKNVDSTAYARINKDIKNLKKAKITEDAM